MDLLSRIERYYDEVPRSTARVEEHGTMRLFVGCGPWPYYGRPSGRDGALVDDVAAVVARQRELGVPRALESVEEVTPELAEAATAAGLAVHRYPLLVLERPQRASPVPDVAVRIAAADDRASRRRAQRSRSGSPTAESSEETPAPASATPGCRRAAARPTRSCAT
jgi:hypothetical protein